MAAVEELVVAAIAEAEATPTATPPATLTAATMPTIGSTRSATLRRLPKLVKASLPTLQDFAICFSPRN
jgi:hypothetical protein